MDLPDLPRAVALGLNAFVASAQEAFGSSIRNVTLFGSAAEGRLRPTSDVNVIVVLTTFDRAAADRLAPALEAARIAIRLGAMFLLESEIKPASIAFAEKFLDIAHRRRVLVGPDLLAAIDVPREVAIQRLQQVLLNFTLRLRESYTLRARDEHALALTVADAAGPLRGCAATLLVLEGKPDIGAREALLQVAREELGDDHATAHLSEAREQRQLPPGVAAPTLFTLIELADRMRLRAARVAAGSAA